MNKKLIGWSWFIAIILMDWHPEWFVQQTTKTWLSIIAILIAIGYTAD